MRSIRFYSILFYSILFYSTYLECVLSRKCILTRKNVSFSFLNFEIHRSYQKEPFLSVAICSRTLFFSLNLIRTHHISCLLRAKLFLCSLWYSTRMQKEYQSFRQSDASEFSLRKTTTLPIEKCAHLKPLDIFTKRKPWAPSTTPSPAAHCPPVPIPTRQTSFPRKV